MRKLLFTGATTVALIAVAGCEDIVGPIGDPVALSYALCEGAEDMPSWFAVQDGDGSWQRVSESASGSFDFEIASGRGGIAMYTPGGSDPGLYVVYATTEELEANMPACNGSVRTVTGSVTGYATADNVALAMGASDDVVFGSEPPPSFFSLPNVDATVTDLVAIRYRTSSGGNVAFESIPNNVVLRRNVTGTSTSLLDFSSATEAGAPLRREINITNSVSGEAISVRSSVALNSTVALIAAYDTYSALVSGSVIVAFHGLPAARLNSDETNVTRVSATKSAGSGSETRYSSFVFSNPVDQSLTLGPALGAVTVAGSSRPAATYNVQASYDKLFDVIFSQGNGSTARQIEVLATSAYLDGATTVTLAVPNLSGVAGFSSDWLLVPGVSSFWDFFAADADASLLTGRPIAFQGAQRASTFTP
jgi:hypothetical protein